MKRDRIRSERGVALVEFALILPVFLLLVVAVLEFGRAFTYWLNANSVANQGARWAIVDRNPGDNPPGGTVEEQLWQWMCGRASTDEMRSGLQVAIDYPEGGTLDIGEPLRVRITKNFDFIPFFDQPTIAIRGEAVMRVENFLGSNGFAPGSYAAGSWTCS